MIRIIWGDITELKDVDVIVNSAKKSLKGGGGVDGSIHSKAGWELLEECKSLNGCETGEAKITKGYDLYVPYVIHAVGPIYYDKDWSNERKYDPEVLLKNAYMNSLKLAKEYDLKRIAFSAISTGAYGYPMNEAAKIAIETCLEFLDENPLFEITFILYLESFFQEYINQITNYNVEFSTSKLDDNFEDTYSINDIKNRYNNLFPDENKGDTQHETIDPVFDTLISKPDSKLNALIKKFRDMLK